MERSRHVALYVSGTVLQNAVVLGTGVLIARKLGASDYGASAVLRNLLTTVLIIAPLGLDLGLYRYFSATPMSIALRRVQQLRALVFCLTAALVLACFLGGGDFLGRHVYRVEHFGLLLGLTFLALPFAADVQILGAVYRARGNPTPQILCMLFLQPIVRAVAVALLLTGGRGLVGVALANTTASAVAAAVLAVDFARRFGSDVARPSRPVLSDVGEIRELLSYSLWMAVALLVYGNLRSIDVLFLGSLATPRDAGEYGAMSSVAALIQVYPLALSQTLGPRVALHYANNRPEEIRDAFSSYIRTASILAAPIFAGAAVFAPDLRLLFGHTFSFSSEVAFTVSAAYLISALLAPCGFALSMTGRHRLELLILCAGTAGAAVLCWLLIPRFGQLGAAGAVAAAYVGINVGRFLVVGRTLGFFPGSWSDLIPPVFALLLAWLCRTGGEALLGHTIGSVLASGTTFGLITAGAFWSLVLRASEREFIMNRGMALRTRLAA